MSLEFLIDIFPAAYCSGFDSISNRNEYQEYFLGGISGRYLRLTTLPLSCDECLEILGISTSRKTQGPARPL